MDRPPGHPRGAHGNPGRMVQFWYFFFRQGRGGGQLFSFGDIFARPRGHTQGICLSIGQWYIALDLSFFAPFYFISMPNFMLWGYLSLILCPLPRGCEWFLFVTRNNSPGVSRGLNHGEANDKCIMFSFESMDNTLIVVGSLDNFSLQISRTKCFVPHEVRHRIFNTS